MGIQLQPDEHLVLECRRHWIYLYPPLIGIALLLLVPVAGVLVVIDQLDASGIGRTILLGIAGLWAIYWGIRLYFVWYRYRNDLWWITNQRLIDQQRKHWFHQEVSSADLVDVQDTSVDRTGLLQTSMNFGNLLCQTAGQQTNFVLNGIPDPVGVLSTLDRTRDAARRDIA